MAVYNQAIINYLGGWQVICSGWCCCSSFFFGFQLRPLKTESQTSPGYERYEKVQFDRTTKRQCRLWQPHALPGKGSGIAYPLPKRSAAVNPLPETFKRTLLRPLSVASSALHPRMLNWLFLLLGASTLVGSLDLPPAATPRSSSGRERPPWGQPTQIRPGYIRTLQADRDGISEGCPQGEAVEDLEWVVQLKEHTMEKSLLGHKYKKSLTTEELYSIANSIAAESRLKGVVHIEQFNGVFKLQYEPREKWLLHRKRSAGLRRASPMLWRRGVERFHRTLASLDKDLEGHPQVEWAMRQRCLVRQKRAFELDFNDPMFNKQWHLVSRGREGGRVGWREREGG